MPSTEAPPATRVREVLAAAVEALGGQERPGQIQMAEAVAAAMTTGEHLLVQAGTGTGKSLAYLVPALLHDRRVVVATATLALQHQLVERDIPALLEARGPRAAQRRRRTPCSRAARNYACLHRIREGVPDDQGTLVDLPSGLDGQRGAGAARRGPRSRAETKGAGDRDSRAQAHRPGLAAGLGQPPRVPGRREVPVRRGVLRRARQGEGRCSPS